MVPRGTKYKNIQVKIYTTLNSCSQPAGAPLGLYGSENEKDYNISILKSFQTLMSNEIVGYKALN
jgi:sulfite reductase beta subunit-like hemoprotein